MTVLKGIKVWKKQILSGRVHSDLKVIPDVLVLLFFCCEETLWSRQFIKESICLHTVSENECMTILVGTMGVGRQA